MQYRFGGYGFQCVEQRRRFGATVGFHDAGDDIAAFVAQLARGQQHRESLADARRRAEINAQLPAPRLGLLAVDPGQQRIRVGTPVARDAHLPILRDPGVKAL